MAVKLISIVITCFLGISMNGQINWKVDSKQATNDVGPTHQHYLTGVSFNSSTVEWAAKAPSVYTKQPFYTGKTKIDVNQSNQLPVFLSDQPYSNSSIIAIPYTAGLLILDAQTGKQIQWMENELEGNHIFPSMRNAYWFDDGTYKISCGKKTFESDLVYNASFLKEFKQYLLYFNHRQLVILNKKNGKILDTVALDKRLEKKARVYATAQWKKLTVNWDGIIYR